MHTAETHSLETRFGFIPQFKSHHGAYSSLSEAVRETGPVSLDFSALNVFFRAGLFLGGATPFREIRRCITKPVIVSPIEIRRDAAIDAYVDLFRQSIRRRLQPDTAITLSGGCDSRHILFELSRVNKLPSYAITVNVPGKSSEVSIAEQVASRVGIRHVVVSSDPSDAVDDECWKNKATDFMSLEHGWFTPVGKSRDNRPMWDGIGGDVLSAGLFLEPDNLMLFRQSKLDELADKLVSPRPVPYFRDQSLFPRILALDAVRQELEVHKPAANPCGSFYFWNRTRVAIAAAPFGLVGNAIAPYLDHDLWRFLSSLPADILIDHTFHKDTIRRAYPEFSSIPFFASYDAVDPRIHKKKLLSLIACLLRNGSRQENLVMVAKALRSLLIPSRRADVEWLLPISVYCNQISQMAYADSVI